MKSVNPEGIPSLSPGLRGTSYPGLRSLEDLPTPTGLYQTDASTDATPLGLNPISNGFPRVARDSQPWAELCNPFGIASARVPKLWVVINPGERAGVWADAFVNCIDAPKRGATTLKRTWNRFCGFPGDCIASVNAKTRVPSGLHLEFQGRSSC